MNASCAWNDERSNLDELLQQLERECLGIVPAATLGLLLEPLRALAATVPAERDALLAEAAINRFEDVLEAFLMKETSTSS